MDEETEAEKICQLVKWEVFLLLSDSLHSSLGSGNRALNMTTSPHCSEAK